MNKKILFILIALFSFVCACDQDIEGFEKSDSYIYFDIPFIPDYAGRPTEVREDSLSYSFAMDGSEVTSTIIEVPIRIIGVSSDIDRDFKVSVVNGEGKTTADNSDWDMNSISSLTIKKGELGTTIPIKINRTEAMKSEWRHLYLQIEPNEHFELGYADLNEVKLSFSDILIPPGWWSAWSYWFGPFYREVYIKWQEIYYEGVDPNTSFDNGEPLWWGNMPTWVVMNFYQSTFLFVGILKDYFENNDIYPDGDTTKDPIRLP